MTDERKHEAIREPEQAEGAEGEANVVDDTVGKAGDGIPLQDESLEKVAGGWRINLPDLVPIVHIKDTIRTE